MSFIVGTELKTAFKERNCESSSKGSQTPRRDDRRLKKGNTGIRGKKEELISWMYKILNKVRCFCQEQSNTTYHTQVRMFFTGTGTYRLLMNVGI